MLRLSIKTKLIVILSCVLIAAFAGINLANYWVSRGSLRSNALEETLPLIGDNIYSEIQKDLMRPLDVSSLMSNDTFLKDWALNGEKDVSQITRYLKEIKERYGFFTSFFISERSRLYYYHGGVLKKISALDAHDIWYFIFKNSGLPVDLDVDKNQADKGALTIFINHRLEDYDGNLLGVTGVGLNMNRTGKILRSYQGEYKRTVYLVDTKGVIQLHTNPELIEKVNISQPDWFGAAAQKVLDPKEGSTSHEVDRGGKHLLICSRYVPRFGWYLIVEQDEDGALQDIRTAMFSSLAVGLLVTIFIIAVVVVAVNHFQGRLEELATTDELTNLHNRRHFLNILEHEAVRATRYSHKVSLLMIDADHFKKINDNHGHQAGDIALQLMAKAIKDCLRQVDALGRLGGEEFAVLLPETGQEEAVEVAQRIRAAVESTPLRLHNQTLQVTVSLGVATSMHGPVKVGTLLKKADMAMYQAKKQGRNQVCVAGPQDAACLS